MENIMSKWSRKFGKILTAAGISAFIAVSSLTVPIEASAARAVTDDIMIRNDNMMYMLDYVLDDAGIPMEIRCDRLV